MSRPTSRPLSAVIPAALLLGLLIGGCSDDGGSGPTDPDAPLPPNTPAIPTVDNPGDELPTRSEFLTVESAELENLSPELAGASEAMLARLDQA